MAENHSWLRYLILGLATLPVMVSFMLESLVGNSRIYLGTERLAAAAGTFPANLDTVWEIKPVGNRLIFYVLDRIANPWWGTFTYEVVVKVIPALVLILIIWYFARMVARKWGLPFEYPYMLAFLGIFAVGNFVILEPEWTAVGVVLLMTALLLEEREWAWWTAGLLVAPLLLLKGITLLMAPLPFIAYLLVTRQRIRGVLWPALDFVAGVVGAAILTVLAWVTLFPHMVPDFLISAAIGKVAYDPILRRLELLTYYGFGLVGFMPLIVIGLVVGVMACCYAGPRDRRDLGLLLALWAIPVAIVLIQSEYFYYHFAPMIFAAIFTVLWALKKVPKPDRWFLGVVVTVLVLWALLVAGWSPALHGTPWAYWKDRTNGAEAIDALYNLSGQPELLYLDAGDGPWLFGAPSACRFVTPLPVQRNLPEWNITAVPGYRDTWDCIVNYQGDYILSNDPWWRWNVTTHAPLKEIIDARYVHVWNSTEKALKHPAWTGLDVYVKRNSSAYAWRSIDTIP